MLEIQNRRKEVFVEEGDEPVKEQRVGLGERGHFDRDIYDEMTGGKYAGYVTSIATDEQDVSIITQIYRLNYY